jgi:hypothetical protein
MFHSFNLGKGKLQGLNLIIFLTINRHSINQEIASSNSYLAKDQGLERTLTLSPDLQTINSSLSKYGVTLQSQDPEVDSSQKSALSSQLEQSSRTTALIELSQLMIRAGNLKP